MSMSPEEFFNVLVKPPCYIIAEAGVNHNGDMDIAREMIEVAADAGANAVKFQSFRPKDLVSLNAPKAQYQLKNTSEVESQRAMLEALALSDNDHEELIAYCSKKGIQFLTTPFEEQSLSSLSRYNLPLYKIPSGEVTNLPFLSAVGETGKAVILSTGMARLDEVSRAVDTLKRAGCSQLALLHCVSNYPARSEDANLRAMETLRSTFGLPVGYSDHTMGIEISLAAVALGARIIEKHFSLDRNMPGPDQRASIEPDELAQLVVQARRIEGSLGTGEKVPVASEAEVARVARKSLFASCAVASGEIVEPRHLVAKRPGDGISPDRLNEVIGKRTKVSIGEEEKIAWEMFEE